MIHESFQWKVYMKMEKREKTDKERKKIILVGGALIILLSIGLNGFVIAKDANASQFFFMVKRLFPAVKEVSVFISEERLNARKTMIERAAMQNKIRVKIFLIETSIDVGKRIRDLSENEVLVIFNSDVLLKKSTQLYILKNCKEKHIAVFTSSRIYSELGALLGIIKNGGGTTDLVLNLKHNEYLKPTFSEAFIEQAGITEVIQ